MRISTTLALAAALAATTACKKKTTEDTNKPVEGSNMAGSNMAGSNMAGSSMAGSNTAPKPLTSDEIVAKYKECGTLITSGDYDKFKSTCVADSYKSHDATTGKDATGDEMLAEMKQMMAGFSNTKFDPQLILVNGTTVAAINLMAGDVKANSMMGPDGKPMGPAKDGKISELFFHRLKLDATTGKATDEWSIADAGSMMGQLGMLPPMPKGTPAPRGPATAWPGAPIVVIAANDAKEKANLDVVKKGNDAFNAHDAAGCTALMADDAVESDQADEKDTTGKAAIEKGTGEFMKAVPDGKVEISETWAAGDYVVAIGTFTGTMNKNPVTMEFSEVSQLKDGKIAKVWRFRNGMAAMQAMMGGPGGPGGPATKGKDKDGDNDGDEDDKKKMDKDDK